MTKMCVIPGIEPGTFGIAAQRSSAELYNTIAICQAGALPACGGGGAGLGTQHPCPHHIVFLPLEGLWGRRNFTPVPQPLSLPQTYG